MFHGSILALFSHMIRYPFKTIYVDYLTAIFGLGIVGVPLFALPIIPWLFGVLLGFGGLFFVFLILTLVRSLTTLSITQERITQHTPWTKTLEWDSLSSLTLQYYAIRSSNAWMHLILKTPGQRLVVDSRIENFTEIVLRAARAAYRNRLPLTRATESNLAALGIEPPEVAS